MVRKGKSTRGPGQRLPLGSCGAGALALGMLLLLGASCSSTSDPATGDPLVDLASGDPRVRIEGAKIAAVENRKDALEALCARLSDEDAAVRMFSDLALRQLTGQDFDFKPHGTIAEREEARRRWVEWLAKERAGAPQQDKPDGQAAKKQ